MVMITVLIIVLTIKNKGFMKTRKERVAEFMVQIESLDMNRLRVACYNRASQLPELDDMGVIVNHLKAEFAEREESWIIMEIADEYNRIANMSEHNLQVWADYRRNNNVDAPVANLTGEFVDVSFAYLVVCLDGNYYTISQHGVTIENGEANMSIVYMQKLQMIASHLQEIKRLVE